MALFTGQCFLFGLFFLSDLSTESVAGQEEEASPQGYTLSFQRERDQVESGKGSFHYI